MPSKIPTRPSTQKAPVRKASPAKQTTAIEEVKPIVEVAPEKIESKEDLETLLIQTRSALNSSLSQAAFVEVFAFSKPPEKIAELFAAVAYLLGQKETDWSAIRRIGKLRLMAMI